MDTARKPADKARPRPSSEDAGQPRRTEETAPNRAVSFFRDYWLDLPKETAYSTGRIIYAVYITEKEQGWRVVLKARHRGRYQVAFMWGKTWQEALQLVVEWVEKGELDWRPDKYSPKQ